jgi:hypothetical protein
MIISLKKRDSGVRRARNLFFSTEVTIQLGIKYSCVLNVSGDFDNLWGINCKQKKKNMLTANPYLLLDPHPFPKYRSTSSL